MIVYQRVNLHCSMLFPWFSHDFPMIPMGRRVATGQACIVTSVTSDGLVAEWNNSGVAPRCQDHHCCGYGKSHGKLKSLKIDFNNRSIIYTHTCHFHPFSNFSWQTVSLLEGISSISIERSIQNATFLQPNDGD